MADVPTPTQVTQNLPSPYLTGAFTALGERLLPLLSTSAAINTTSYAQQVAPESQLQQQARGLAGGLGDYQQYLNQAQQYSGPQAYQQFMSPYQQQVIDTTLTEFDKQRQQAMAGQNAQAIAGGAFGGAREGIQKAEYGAQTLQDRSALQAQLLQQGYGQAQQQANTAFQQQQGLASLQPQLLGSQIGAMSALGQQQQAQQQAVLDAQASAAKEAAFEPYTRYGLVGQQLTGLAGGFPTQVQTYNAQQSASPLQSFLGTLTGLGGLAGKVVGKGGIFG
jgi:NADH dehydrogenase/NADH:ubiquinone oxidoreductase subunit G